jgi:hypothetical protein
MFTYPLLVNDTLLPTCNYHFHVKNDCLGNHKCFIFIDNLKIRTNNAKTYLQTGNVMNLPSSSDGVISAMPPHTPLLRSYALENNNKWYVV